ncbi:MAG TPA: hypothetical protein VF035_07735 [Longimicrobiales bacterium]
MSWKYWLVVCLMLYATWAMPSAARGQTRADTASVLMDAARQLDADGRRDAARALMELVQRRYAGTPAAAAASAMLASPGARSQADEPGRVELAVFGTTYGLWLGVAVPLMLDIDKAEAYGVGLLTGAPAGFLAARAYNKKHPSLTVGQARAITFGGTWGTWQGFGWTEVLLDGSTEDCTEGGCFFEDDPTTEQLVGAMVAGGVLGIGTGAILARKPISSGVATTVSLAGMWGTWFGGAAGAMANYEGDNLLAAALVGGDAALIAGAVLAPRWNVSRSRARLVSLAGIIGGVAGGGVDLILQPDNEDVALGVPLAGSIAGLLAGAHLTRNYDARNSDRGGANPPGEALLEWDDGMRLGSFTPMPALRRAPVDDARALRRTDRPERMRLEPALSVNLFQARF